VTKVKNIWVILLFFFAFLYICAFEPNQYTIS
jgi:hypothetical protein